MALTLVLVDDHQLVREGLRALLQMVPGVRLVGEAGDGAEALRLVGKVKPDVLILDLMLPGLSGLDVARQVRTRSPATRVVILSMHADKAYVVAGLRAGAVAYVLKQDSAEHLVKAIHEAAAG